MRLVSKSTLVPLAQPPKKLMTPPLRTISSACCQASARPTASMTASAPRPAVRSRTAPMGSATEDTSMTSSAPKRFAVLSCASRFTKLNTRAPLDLTACMNIRPMGTAPMITTESQGRMPVSFTPSRTQASGSTLAAVTKKALAARRGVHRDDAHAGTKMLHAATDLDNFAGQLVAEERGRGDHAGVVSPAKNFEVRAAGEGDADLDQDFAFANLRDGHALDLDVLFAVKDGGCHAAVGGHLCPPFSQAAPGVRTTLSDSGWGCAARCRASPAFSSGKRWVMRRLKSISPLKTKRADSSCKSIEAL